MAQTFFLLACLCLGLASSSLLPDVRRKTFESSHRRAQALRSILRARTDDKTSYAECNIPAFERIDCGYFGIDEEECQSRDCCWKESNIQDVPWCYHTKSFSTEVCIIEATERTDCGYYGINSEECVDDRGCCWMPTDVENAPWCFDPIEPQFSEDCGKPAIAPNVDTRIVGGEEAVAHSWPWQVSLQAGGHFCGGSVVAPNWIITAAHCAPGFEWSSPENRKVVLGMHNMYADESSKIEVGLLEILPHENYGDIEFDNDIMLLKIDRSIEYTDEISAVCLPRTGELVDAGTDAYTTGWGNTGFMGGSPDDLQQVLVPIIDLDTCTQSDWYGSDLTENMVCAGYEEGGKDSCQGDSGGPLVSKVNGHWTLVGIVSWGEGCASPKKPGIYTNVANYIDWIEEKMDEYA